ncbi:MAG: DMT family transporter [Pseudomonadota bacterium]
MRHQFQLYAMLLCLGIVWGLNFSLIKFAALSGLPFSTIALLVILGNMIIFGAFSLILTGRLRLPFSRVAFFAGCGLLGYLLPFFLELFAVPKLGAGTLALMVSLAPITTVLLAAAAGADKITPRRAFGAILGFCAIAPIAISRIDELQSGFGLALLAGLAVPITYASYHVYISKFWPEGYEPFEVATGETIGAVAFMVPIYALSMGMDPIPDQPISTYWVIGELLSFSALEVWLYFSLMRKGGPVFVAQTGYVSVTSGVIWGALLFGEAISPWLLASVAIMITALILVAPGKTADEDETQLA